MESNKQMHMIRHYDEIGQFVALAVKVQQTIGNDQAQFGPFQYAFTSSAIQLAIPSSKQFPLH